MKMLDNGLKICEIHCITGFPQNTIRTIKCNKNENKKSVSGQEIFCLESQQSEISFFYIFGM